jgi:hypothetical protein
MAMTSQVISTNCTRPKSIWLVGGSAVFLLYLAFSAAAQTTGTKPAEEPARIACAARIPASPHSEVLVKVCEYALSLPRRMPNFTCRQETTRYRNDQPLDVITAIVAYEGGQESYREITKNGMPVNHAAVMNTASWSTGQFGGDIQSLFDSRNEINFQFVNEREIEGRPVLTFQYKVQQQVAPVWRLHFQDQTLTPSFHGQLRIDASTGRVLRLLVAASELPRSYPLRAVDVDIKYETVSFGDGTDFVLPVKSVLNGMDRKGVRIRNELDFRSCHKFTATARVVPE